MPIFKLKKGPILRWSRAIHFGIAVAATQAGGMIWGDSGYAYGAAAAVVGGLAWEVSNRYTKGYHQYGDMWDWLAFVAGGLTVGGLRSIF